jgi:hypothetical protein
MTSLRDTMETTFAAAAFAERNLNQEASSLVGTSEQGKRHTSAQTTSARAAAQAKRPRPSLKA